ncbi:S-4TM family putative pore-forming effector [Fundicoccus sp. Sow4_D5]|uniref:S-4TM family putative pore-forming effector n=1 Tax=Fundicoccus sp. Sow4_D5 TaxID=3438782 RepID=UPI003F8DED05
MNNILKKQNSKVVLSCQAAARHHYNRADNLAISFWSLNIIIVIFKLYFPSSIFLNFFLLVNFLYSFFIDKKIAYHTNIGASLKNEVDNFVFDWSDKISEHLIIEARNVQAKKRKWFENQISHDGGLNSKGVRDWYDGVNKEDNQFNSIKKAMRTNIDYDSEINKTLLIILILFYIIFFIQFLHLSVLNFILLLILVMFPFLKQTYKIITNVYKIIKDNKIIKKRLNFAEDMEDLFQIQPYIHAKRQIPYTSPFFLYNLLRKKLFKAFLIIFN